MGFTPSGNQELAVEITASDEGASDAFDDVAGSASGMKTAVLGASAALAGAGVAALAKATQAAASFEQAMVEVEKVTSPETARKMSDAIREMATEIPMAQEKIAGLAADAARFGIKGPKNIRQFTKSVAKMASATTLNAQEAGQSLAKLAELTNTPVSEIENLGSAINSLSNNFATSSQEIVDSMMRSAGALSQLGLNQKQIAGVSAALNEVSESSERAGTRLRRIAQELMNPKNVSKFANALGVTEEKFKQLRSNAPNKLILQMATAMKEGGKEADQFRKALSTTSRQALAGLGQNLKGTRKALEKSNSAYQKATSLQKEFNKQTSTFNSQVQLLKNRLRNIGIVMGNQILPILTKGLKKITPLIEGFAKFNKRMDGMPAIIMAVTATLTGLVGVVSALGISITGTLLPAIAMVGGLAAVGYTLYKAWKTNFAGIRTVVKKTVKTIKKTFKSNEEQFKELKETLKELRKQFETALKKVKSAVKFVIKNFVIPLIKRLRKIWKENFSEIASEAVKTFKYIHKKIKKYGKLISKFWNENGDEIMRITKTVFDFIILVIDTAMRAVLTTIKVILALIRGDWKSALKYIREFFEKTFDKVLKFLKNSFLKGLKAALKLVVKAIKWPFKQIYKFLIGNSIVPKTFNKIISFLKTNFLPSLKTTLDLIFKAYKKAFKRVKSAVLDIFDSMKKAVMRTMRALGDAVLNKIKSIIEDFKSTFNNAIPDELHVPQITIGGGGIDIPSTTVGGKTIGGGYLGIPSETIGGQDLDLPQLGSGGIVDSATMAMIGEAGKEAVVPLNKLNRYLDTAFDVGRETAPVGTSGTSGGSDSTSVTARLKIEGDGALAELIRENAEIVFEEREQDKQDRIARF
jgi:TP901 family phage tail tape measure protein